MSEGRIEEDPELRELVTEALEKTGVLAAVRAHLRAGVFLALEREHEQKRSHHAHLQQMLNTHDGRLALLLVHELLEFCRLHHTASVYSAETGQPHTYTYKGRDSLLYDLKLNDSTDKSHLPVLVQLISIVFKLNKNSASTSQEIMKKVLDPNDSNVQNEPFVTNSPDNYDTTFTSDSTNHSIQSEKNKVVLQLDLNGSGDVDKSSSDHIEDDKSSVLSEPSLNADAHIELHTDSDKSLSESVNTKQKEQSRESNNEEANSKISAKTEASIPETTQNNMTGNESEANPTYNNTSQYSTNKSDASDESISEEIRYDDNDNSDSYKSSSDQLNSRNDSPSLRSSKEETDDDSFIKSLIKPLHSKLINNINSKDDDNTNSESSTSGHSINNGGGKLQKKNVQSDTAEKISTIPSKGKVLPSYDNKITLKSTQLQNTNGSD
ncbi:uncharacterized protein LOC143917561 [Arctopsyche grandis]|uniref:uncharacterized protein LOC143917561 n=1 Tax=Arctopsyche grandis TaxID=121162 RepID=UPI00406D9C2F